MIQSKISVIIPVYNVEKYVSKCVESVINQTYKNLEIIIVNDGSKDTSFNICNFYANMDNRIIIINQDNQGLSVARNNALDIASGEYVGFVDSDDWIASDMYEILYKNIQEYNAEITMCNFNCAYENGKISPPKINYNINSMLVLEGYEKIKKVIQHSNYFVWNKLYKRYLFDDLKFPIGKTYEDAFIIPEIIGRATKIVICPDFLYYYIIRNDSITHVPFTPSRFNMVLACIEVYEYAKKIPVLEPELEKLCRKRIFTSLLSCIFSAISTNIINSCMDDAKKIIDLVNKYDIHECNLDPNTEKTIKLILEDIRKYIIIYNYSKSQPNSIFNLN